MKKHDCDRGTVYFYWVNHKTKQLVSDWAYCPVCYPDSSADFSMDLEIGWQMCPNPWELEKRGYKFTDIFS